MRMRKASPEAVSLLVSSKQKGEPEIPTSIDSHKTDPQITSRGGVLFVYTPSLQPVMVITLNGKIVRYQKQVGLQGYEGLPFGTYVIRINEKTFKIQLSK